MGLVALIPSLLCEGIGLRMLLRLFIVLLLVGLRCTLRFVKYLS